MRYLNIGLLVVPLYTIIAARKLMIGYVTFIHT